MSDKINQEEINGILWSACDTFRGTVDPAEYKNYILVMLFVNQKQRRALKQQSRPAWLMLSVVSVFLVVGHVCRFTALKYSPVSVVQPLIATIVIFVLLFSWIINRKIDYFNWQVIVGIFLVLAGVFTIYGWFS